MKQTFIKSAMLLLLILSMATTRAQEVALKTNLLGWASTSANAGIEIGTGKKTTFQLFGTLNPWKFSGDKKMRFWNVMPEYRWYTCQKFGGHFYTVRPFSIEEAKEILKTKPQQLSLQEMFLVAQTYEPGSPEFNEVFDIAVRLFPDDETANLNAACTDLQKGDLTSAEKHLAKAGNSKEAERVRDVFKQIKELE